MSFEGIRKYELTEIVRQEEDNPVLSLLNILRDDIKNNKNNFLAYLMNNRSSFDASNIKGYAVMHNDDFC